METESYTSSGQPNRVPAIGTSSLRSFQLHSWPYSSAQTNDTIKYITQLQFKDELGVHQNITAGASVSVPSEELSFYLGGMARANYSTVRYPLRDNNLVTTRSFFKCNITQLDRPSCRSLELAAEIESRAGAELLWLPIGVQGALVLIGGVSMLSNVLPTAVNTNSTDNTRFMSTVSIYDIASNRWFNQPTKASAQYPPQSARFCAVTAIAQDQSSYNIYLYGGYDGIGRSEAYDDVWVLSIPAFEWIQVQKSSNTAHRRTNHRCFSPYPDQMITVGGTLVNFGPLGTSDMFDVFSLNTLNWTGKYDPLKWSKYEVPSKISAIIGGGKSGKANTDKQLKALDPNLAALFRTKYSKEVRVYYPYATKGVKYYFRKIPHWLRVVIGAVAYLAVFSGAFICLLLLRQRKHLQYAGPEGADLGPGHSAITYLEKHSSKWRRKPARSISESQETLKPPPIPYKDNSAPDNGTPPEYDDEARSIRTRMSDRSDQHLLSEDFEMSTLNTVHSRIST